MRVTAMISAAVSGSSGWLVVRPALSSETSSVCKPMTTSSLLFVVSKPQSCGLIGKRTTKAGCETNFTLTAHQVISANQNPGNNDIGRQVVRKNRNRPNGSVKRQEKQQQTNSRDE